MPFRVTNVLRYAEAMQTYDPVRFTRELIDVPSISGEEGAVGAFLADALAARNYQVEKMPVAEGRFNVFALPKHCESAEIVLSTHMDTVPPFIASSEDAENIYGRGACDAKGIIAAQLGAAEQLRTSGTNVGLLFLVGEERDSLGAKIANAHPRGSRFLINGEPTDNRIAVASKGALRVELVANGKMAHSAYPQLGESAIEKLVHAIEKLLAMKLPHDPEVGDCTVNVGVIEGGRAPNVIPDRATALLLYRLVGPSDDLRQAVTRAVTGLADANFTLEIPFVKLRTVAGIDTMKAAFTTDIPALTDWGEPVLLGPGSIHVAHTPGEFLSKRELHAAIELYVRVVRQLLQ